MRGLSLEEQKCLAASITRVLSLYGYIADASIIEFFTDDLWSLLPLSWQAALANLPSPHLAALLLEKRSLHRVSYSVVWPLSLLAFKATAHALAFPRRRAQGWTGPSWDSRPEEFQENLCQSSRLHPLFRKHVKPKKQHEIQCLGQVVKTLSEVTGSGRVVDVGSGQGHLSRFLAFGLHLPVTGVEGDARLVARATRFDQELLQALKKEQAKGTLAGGLLSLRGPSHVVGWVDTAAQWPAFLRMLDKAGGHSLPAVDDGRVTADGDYVGTTEDGQPLLLACDQGREAAVGVSGGGSHRVDTSAPLKEGSMLGAGRNGGLPPTYSQDPLPGRVTFLLTGLHACGDLSVALLRHFVRCPDVVGITSVACCYMKLSTGGPSALLGPSSPLKHGYPLSRWVSALPGHRLSYRAREGACHALEDFARRLSQESPTLRAHCFRAVLEVVIRGLDPTKKCLGVQTIKKAHRLTFAQYAHLGLERVGLKSRLPTELSVLEAMLAQQQKVVAFLCLALLVAPLAETLLLLDRMIYLQEQGFQCDLIPLFEPQFSPRNLVLVAAKVPLSGNFSGLAKKT